MSTWTWFAHDLKTGALTARLAVESWSHTSTLNDAGDFSGTHSSRGHILDTAALGATLPARATVTPLRDGKPVDGYCGVVWGVDAPTITGASLLSYFDDQTLDTTKAYVSVDQHTMLVDLVDWVQGNGGNIAVDTGLVEASGVLRDQTWRVWEQKNVGEAFRQKSDNLGGFDFDFRVELDGSALRRRLRLWTPRRGRPYQPQASPVFKVGGNVLSVPSARADGSKMVTDVVALGGETGVVETIGDSEVRERLVARSVRTDLLDSGYPRLSATLERNDVKDQATLQQHADGYAARYGAVQIDQLTLEVDPNDRTWPFGSWEIGDDCLVVIPGPIQESHTTITEFGVVDADGFGIGTGLGDGSTLGTVTETVTYSTKTTLPWWPQGLNEVRRVIAHQWSRDASGERLEVVTGRALEV